MTAVYSYRLMRRGGNFVDFIDGQPIPAPFGSERVTSEEFEQLEAISNLPLAVVDSDTKRQVAEAAIKIAMTKVGYPLKHLEEEIQQFEPSFELKYSKIEWESCSVRFLACVGHKRELYGRTIKFEVGRADYSIDDVADFLSLIIQNIRKLKIDHEWGDYHCIVENCLENNK